jgi:hypothetical protein
MISNFGPVAVALISWIVFNAIGRPLLRFFDLRTEVRRATILYDNVRARWTERDNVRVSASDDEDTTPDNFEDCRRPNINIETWGRRFGHSPTRNRRPVSFFGGLVMIFERPRLV